MRILPCLIALAVVGASPALAQPAPGQGLRTLVDHTAATRAARLRGDTQAWRDLAEKSLAFAPDHPDLMISLARAEARLGHDEAAVARLDAAATRGAGLDAARFEEFARLEKHPRFAEVAARSRANLTPVDTVERFALLADPGASPEGVAYDRETGRVFTGTAHGEILQIDRSGAVTTFVKGVGLREVYGLKTDPDRRLLWAATSVFPGLFQDGAAPKTDLGLSGVMAFNLDTGAPAGAYWLDERPVVHGFNDLVAARNGDVFVTDSVQGAVYRLRPSEGRFHRLTGEVALSFANGVALSADQTRLYVAHIEGISLVDPQTGAVTRLTVPDTAAVNSLDGLAFHQGALLGVQGSAYFRRIIRIELDPTGTAVTRVSALSARSGLYNQTTIAVGDGRLYIAANTPAVDASGQPLAQAAQPQIQAVPLA